MLANAKQQKAYDLIAAALPFALDASKVTVTPGVSYVKSPVKAHDYAAGIMAAFGSVVEHLGTVRGLPPQALTLDRRPVFSACFAERNELLATLREIAKHREEVPKITVFVRVNKLESGSYRLGTSPPTNQRPLRD